MDDDLWEVALPSGEVKRMSLDQLDRAFQVGLIHSNTLIREGGTTEWQTLGAVAGLDEEPATEVSTQRGEPASEPGRASVLPSPGAPGSKAEEEGRETLAGLGGFLNVGPALGSSKAAAPGLGSRPPPLPAGAFAGASAPPMPTARVTTKSAPPPALPNKPLKQTAIGLGGAPPLPANAFGSPPAGGRQQAPSARPPAPDSTRRVPPAPKSTRNPAPPAPKPASASLAPPPLKTGGPSVRPPPLPPGAFASVPPASAAPASLAPSPAFAPLGSAPPPPRTASAAPMVDFQQSSRSRPAGARLANVCIAAFTFLTLVVALHRNGVLFDLAQSLGVASSYEKFEASVLGPPGADTPRGVALLIDSTSAQTATSTSPTTSAK